MINEIVKNSRLTLLGDLGQSIFYPRGIDRWEDAFNGLHLFENKSFKFNTKTPKVKIIKICEMKKEKWEKSLLTPSFLWGGIVKR